MEEKITPHFSEVFKGPFTADEQCCYIWCNDGTQVCFDVMDERDAALGKRIADCLNDAPDKKTFYDIGVSKDGQYICDGHSPILCVRGWGHLTGTGGLNLTGEQAREIQDEFVRWAAEQLGGFYCGETRLEIAKENMVLRENTKCLEIGKDFVRVLRPDGQEETLAMIVLAHDVLRDHIHRSRWVQGNTGDNVF